MPRMWDGKEVAMVGLESSSAPRKGRSTAKWHVERNSKRYSKKGEHTKRRQENTQNIKRSIAKYRGREGRHA